MHVHWFFTWSQKVDQAKNVVQQNLPEMQTTRKIISEELKRKAYVCRKVLGDFTLGDMLLFAGLTSKIPPLGSMINFDADVKKKRPRVTNVKTPFVVNEKRDDTYLSKRALVLSPMRLPPRWALRAAPPSSGDPAPPASASPVNRRRRRGPDTDPQPR